MSGTDIIQETFQFPVSPGKSSSDDQSTSPIDDSRNEFPFDGAEAEKYLHTPRNDSVLATTNEAITTAATLSPQSQPSRPGTPPMTHKATVTPMLQRGRDLQDDELAGHGRGINDQHFPVFVRGSNTEFGSTPVSTNQNFLRYPSDGLTSPNIAVQQNLVMTQQLHRHSRMIEPSNSFSDTPDLNRFSSHDYQEPTNVPVPVSMLWGNDMGGVRHPGDKPKRPLSAYNFYFQLERERIIHSDDDDREMNVTYTLDDVARLTLIQQRKAKENKPKEKRSHRKTHGKISFGDLARTIANRWKQLDKSSKEIFEGSASIEKERYRKELGEWNKQMKKWKDAASKVASTLQFTPNGGLTSGSNHSHHDLDSSGHTSFHNDIHMVTPDQLPKRTVNHNDEIQGNDDTASDHHMMHAIANHQRTMNVNNAIDSICTSSPHGALQPHSKSHRAAALNGVLQQHYAGSLQGATFGNRFSGLRSSLLPQADLNGIGRTNGLGLFDFGDDVTQPYGLNGADGEDEYFRGGEGLDQGAGLLNGNNGYAFDDVTDETYRMAQTMLPPQSTLQRNMMANGNVAGSTFQQQQQRRLLHQRRMRMLMMMQQKYRREQIMMMQMGQYDEGSGLSNTENYAASLNDPQQQYMDQLDDDPSYIDQSAAANHLMMNQADVAAAAAFGRSQQNSHLFQHHQNRLADDVNANRHSGMYDQYHPLSHLLNGENLDDRA
jgi:HMG (high mobility group) box